MLQELNFMILRLFAMIVLFDEILIIFWEFVQTFLSLKLNIFTVLAKF